MCVLVCVCVHTEVCIYVCVCTCMYMSVCVKPFPQHVLISAPRLESDKQVWPVSSLSRWDKGCADQVGILLCK